MTGELALTAEQRDAVGLPDGPYLVTAPPGSGKTEVLIRRTIHLLERSLGEVFRVLALTYTYKAAEELRARVRTAVPGEEQWRVSAMTFHAFGHEMLRNYGGPVGVGPGVTVLDDNEDKRLLLSRALADEGVAVARVPRKEWQELFGAISLLKAELCPPSAAPATAVLGGRLTLRDAYVAYDSVLANEGALDFDTMLTQSVRLLSVDPWVGEHYRAVYRHVLVDEGQEMNAAQYGLLRGLCADELRAVFVVADRDQSINAFAKGGPQHLKSFLADFGARERHLTQNFRSARTVVESASKLAAHIQTRSPSAPPMQADTLAQGWVGAWEFADEAAEAQGVAAWIGTLIEEGLLRQWAHADEDRAVRPEDVCVLGRTRYVFDALVTALETAGIEPLFRSEEGGVLDSELGRSVYNVLRLAVNARDFPSRRRLLDLVGGGATPLAERPSRDQLAAWLRSSTLPAPVRDLLVTIAAGSIDDPQVVPALVGLQVPEAGDPGHLEWLRDQAELERRWLDYQVRTRPSDQSLSGFLTVLAQLQRAVADEPGVRILTPYRARGLGFRAVVILGMSEGTFPYYKASSEAEIDEERRCVYVAATRAARALLITRPAKRLDSYGRVWRDPESRFVGEMGLKMESR